MAGAGVGAGAGAGAEAGAEAAEGAGSIILLNSRYDVLRSSAILLQ